MPNTWSFVSCSSFFLLFIRLSLLFKHDWINKMYNYPAHELVPLWALLFWMMLLMKCAIWIYAYFLNVKDNIGTMHKLRRMITTIARSCTPSEQVPRWISTHGGSLASSLFEFFQFSGQGLDETSQHSKSFGSFSLALLTDARDLLPVSLKSFVDSTCEMTPITQKSFSTTITS